MGMKEVLAELMATEGAVFPDGMADTLTAAYDDDFGISAAAVEAANTENGRLNDEIASLKVKLHDYMAAEAAAMAAGVTDDDTTTTDPDNNDPEDADFDGFFTSEKED